MIVFLNDRWLDAADASIPIDDRGFLLGDGVFETGRLFRGGYFRLEHHLDRLAEGAAALRIPLPSRQRLIEIARELARRNRLTDGSLRITLTRGRPGSPPTLLATLAPVSDSWIQRAERGWNLITATVRHPPPAAGTHLKTIGRTHGLLARLEAEAAGADDALLLSVDGDVVEGPTWNVFWRIGQTLYTPDPATGILEGITRSLILELAAALGYTTIEGRFPRTELDRADEIFATMTSVGPVAIRSLDGRTLPPPTPVLDALRPAYWERVAAEVVPIPPGTDAASP